MRATDLIRRASWLNEVATRVASREVAVLLESYAEDMLKEAAGSPQRRPVRHFSGYA